MSFRAPPSKRASAGLWAGLVAAVALTAAIAPSACTSPERDFGVESGATGAGGATATGTGVTTGSGTNSQGSGGMTTSTAGTASGGSTNATTTGSGGSGGSLEMNGKPCGSGAMCTSGFCVDGVCCDTKCDGVCVACTAALSTGIDGTCSPVGVSTDPHDSCMDEGAASCGKTGTCDGKGACALYDATIECSPQTCTGSTKTLAKMCDGMGVCADKGTQSCGAFPCMGNTCSNQCPNDAACNDPTKYCDLGTGVCVTKNPSGTACQVGKEDQCSAGFCVDGFCCDTACAGTCSACSAAKKGGGMDGVCGSIAVGQDPDSECSDGGAAACKLNGVCDGAGKCQNYAAGTQCAGGMCAGGVQTNPSNCNGTGTCIAGSTVVCSPYVCAGLICEKSCASDGDCIGSDYCSAAACVAKGGGGAACAANNQCSSGFCTDGVCCDSACGGTCQACTAAKKGSGANGTCGSIIAGNDPDNECTDQGSASCGTNGVCSGSGTCQAYAAGTPCGAQSCMNATTQLNAPACSGGSCVSGGTKSCPPYICSGNACKVSCGVDADCSGGNYCSAGACIPKLAQGTACGSASQCGTNYCVDGFCCDTLCNLACQACSAAISGGVNGTCSGQDDCSSCGGSKLCQGGSCLPGPCI